MTPELPSPSSPSHPLPRWARLVFLLAFSAWAFACSGGEEAPSPDPAERGAPASPGAGAESEPREPAAAPGEEADSQVLEGRLPEDYPRDLPVYPEASPGKSLSIPGSASVVTFTSEDSAEEILDFYRSELAGEGWTIRTEREGNLTATKGKRTATIGVNATDSGSEIAVGITEG